MTPIYLDNAASTRISDEVLALTTEVARTAWGNPSSQHPQGAAARGHIETARQRMRAALGDRPSAPPFGAAPSGGAGPFDRGPEMERGGLAPTRGIGDVIWTSGCSEANALAVLGAARVRTGKIVISTMEHPAIGKLADALAHDGREVVRVAPGPGGALDPDAVADAARGAGVVALIAVQNEIGVVQPIAAIAQAVRAVAPDAHIHVDAAQALGKIALDVSQLGVDSIAIAGHKLHAPKSAGALWLRDGMPIAPLWVGGGQQKGLRGGTQDAPSAAGLGLAAERAVQQLPLARTRWLEFAQKVTAVLGERGIAFRQLVPDHRRAPHILALGIPGVSAGAMRNVLSSRGVLISTGSACADGEVKASPVLEAIGLPKDHGMVRLSFALDTGADEVEAATKILADVISELR